MSTQAAAPESTCPVFLALHQPRVPAMPTHRDAHPVFPSRKSVVSYLCLVTPGEVRTTGGNHACSGIYMGCRYLPTLQSAGRQTSGFHGHPEHVPWDRTSPLAPWGWAWLPLPAILFSPLHFPEAIRCRLPLCFCPHSSSCLESPSCPVHLAVHTHPSFLHRAVQTSVPL